MGALPPPLVEVDIPASKAHQYRADRRIRLAERTRKRNQRQCRLLLDIRTLLCRTLPTIEERLPPITVGGGTGGPTPEQLLHNKPVEQLRKYLRKACVAKKEGVIGITIKPWD